MHGVRHPLENRYKTPLKPVINVTHITDIKELIGYIEAWRIAEKGYYRWPYHKVDNRFEWNAPEVS
jgi:hypothetical protein